MCVEVSIELCDVERAQFVGRDFFVWASLVRIGLTRRESSASGGGAESKWLVGGRRLETSEHELVFRLAGVVELEEQRTLQWNDPI